MSELRVAHILRHLYQILVTHFRETRPQPDPQRSLNYRLTVFMLYSQIRLIVNLSFNPIDLIPGWDFQYREIIDAIHIAFGTQQVQPYSEWPTQ